jgi:hypothetical protein
MSSLPSFFFGPHHRFCVSILFFFFKRSYLCCVATLLALTRPSSSSNKREGLSANCITNNSLIDTAAFTIDMMKPSITSFTLLSLMLFGDGAHGFCPTQQHQQRSSASSSLRLVPGQGNQLAAAYTASLSKEEKKEIQSNPAAERPDADPNEPPSSSSHWRALAASRSFVQRVFHLPSSAIKKHPHPTLEGLKETQSSTTTSQPQPTFPFNFIPRHQQQEKEEDYVLYPLVGFQFVKSKDAVDGTDRTIALPTTSHAACRLPTNRHEELYGWFSPGCKLDLYSEDVCHAPTAVQQDNEFKQQT